MSKLLLHKTITLITLTETTLMMRVHVFRQILPLSLTGFVDEDYVHGNYCVKLDDVTTTSVFGLEVGGGGVIAHQTQHQKGRNLINSNGLPIN